MDIKQLEYLIDIAELKSVTRAAEKNFMSQSTLSREVKILEKRIGVNLFVWDNREMRLTEEGILYLNGARDQRKQCFSENGTGRSFLQSFFPFNHLRG